MTIILIKFEMPIFVTISLGELPIVIELVLHDLKRNKNKDSNNTNSQREVVNSLLLAIGLRSYRR